MAWRIKGYGFMLRFSVFIIVSLCLLSGVTQAKIYKWVDDQGVVHFTQTPPVNQQKLGQLKELKMNAGRLSPRFRDGQLYCGSQSIPNGDSDVLRYLVSVKMYLASYKENLVYIRQNNIAGPGQNERIDEYKCLVGWAERELEKNDKQLQELRAEYRFLTAQYQDLSGKKQEGCPQQEGWLVGDDARDWVACDRAYGGDMSKIKKRMKDLFPIIEE